MRRMAVLLLSGVLLLSSVAEAGASVPGKDFTETGCDGYSDSVARLYTAGLGREPERGGFEFWMAEYTAGRWSLPEMAMFFTQSPEFRDSYGTLSQDGFIRQLYRNVLGREGEDGGITFWNAQMNQGMDRGTVLLRFAESPENITNSSTAQPILGPFNEGLTGPWTCVGGTPASPGDAKDCSDFASQSEAQAWFDTYFTWYGDIANLDGDGNGLACEETVSGPVVEPEPVAPEPDPTPAPQPPANPGNSKNCSDFATQPEAQAWFDTYFPFYGDVARLDADGNGIACESLPDTLAAPAPTPEPTPTPAPAPEPEPEPVGPTGSQRLAIQKAEDYLRIFAFSRSGLIDQLEFEGFSTADSTFAVDYLDIDFNAQAVKKAASYLELTSFSRLGLIDQLEFEGFTTAQAIHGTDALSTDYNRQAELKAASYLEFMSFSCQGLIDQLLFEQFTPAQARHGANSTEAC